MCFVFVGLRVRTYVRTSVAQTMAESCNLSLFQPVSCFLCFCCVCCTTYIVYMHRLRNHREKLHHSLFRPVSFFFCYCCFCWTCVHSYMYVGCANRGPWKAAFLAPLCRRCFFVGVAFLICSTRVGEDNDGCVGLRAFLFWAVILYCCCFFLVVVVFCFLFFTAPLFAPSSS